MSAQPDVILERLQVPSPIAGRRFSLEWAAPNVLDDILARMRSEGRQTMNIRTAEEAHVLVCRLDDEPVGWAGLDIATWPAYPELFSLYLYPEYRRYTIGLLLETARWKYVHDMGVKVAYARMELATNFRLFRYRLETGLFKAVDPEDFPKEWLDRCGGCELYGNHCTQQRYVSIDIERALESGQSRLGEMNLDDLPRKFTLEPDDPPNGVASASDLKQRYRPYWI